MHFPGWICLLLEFLCIVSWTCIGAHSMCSLFIEKDDLCMVSPIAQRPIYHPTQARLTSTPV